MKTETIGQSKQGSNTVYDDDYTCTYYGTNCETTIRNWVSHDTALTTVVNIIILLAVLGLLYGLGWYFLVYRNRPFCVDCLKQDIKTRTKYCFDDQPVCSTHWEERDMASETEYECPKHGEILSKEKYEGVTIDKCPEGCIFLDDGELGTIESSARSSGTSTGQAVGLVIGMAID